MEELKLETLNEIINDVIAEDCSEFSNLHENLLEFRDELDQDEMVEFITESYNLTSESELIDLTVYEKENFIEYIKNAY